MLDHKDNEHDKDQNQEKTEDLKSVLSPYMLELNKFTHAVKTATRSPLTVGEMSNARKTFEEQWHGAADHSVHSELYIEWRRGSTLVAESQENAAVCNTIWGGGTLSVVVSLRELYNTRRHHGWAKDDRVVVRDGSHPFQTPTVGVD